MRTVQFALFVTTVIAVPDRVVEGLTAKAREGVEVRVLQRGIE